MTNSTHVEGTLDLAGPLIKEHNILAILTLLSAFLRGERLKGARARNKGA